MSQTALIYDHLKQHGCITASQAVRRFRCYRLAARIYDLQQAGIPITTVRRKGTQRVSYVEYRLATSSN